MQGFVGQSKGFSPSHELLKVTERRIIGLGLHQDEVSLAIMTRMDTAKRNMCTRAAQDMYTHVHSSLLFLIALN